MRKITKSIFLFSFFICLTFIVNGQSRYKGPVDSAGYMDKRYDSTITYYVSHRGKSSYWYFYLNLHDTTDKHSFYRQPISSAEVTKRLCLYKNSKRKIRKSQWFLRASIGLLCLYPGSLVFGIFEAQKSELIGWGAVLTDITGAVMLGIAASNYYVSAIAEYNLITKKKHAGQ